MASDTKTRTALLALQADHDAPHSGLRLVGGASVLERQIDVALALGCTRIWLFTPALDPLAIKAQGLAEQGGAQFRLVQRGRQLLGSLRQQDELLVLAEGLLPAVRECVDVLDTTTGILRVGMEEGRHAGFERLDREYCWAGAMMLPARVLEQLEELGDDIDPISALLRAARVNRVEETTLPESWFVEKKWSLVPTSVPVDHARSQSLAQSDIVMTAIANPLASLIAASSNLVIAAGVCAALVGITAVVAINLGLPAAGLLFLSLGAILTKIWLDARRQADVRVFSGKPSRDVESPLWYAFDAAGVSAFAYGLSTAFDWYAATYIAALAWFTWAAAAHARGRYSRLFRDRSAMWLACAISGFAHQWFVGAVIVTIAGISGFVLNSRNQPAITQV